MLKKILFFIGTLMLMHNQASAAIQTGPVEYSSNGDVMEGYIAYDDAVTSPRGGIIIVSDWMGLRQFTKDKANDLAKQGYVVLAADVYGKGISPANADEAKQLANKYKSDRPLLRARIQAAYDKLTSMKQVDAKKILVMGYCFGGTTALELARSGVPLVGTVTFHGGLSNPTPENANNIHGRVLVLHGADDPFVPPAEVKAFKDEMKKAGVDIRFVAYSGAVHAFAVPTAGNDPSKGAAYNEQADKLSWMEFENFLSEVLKN
jgi:dienelactone hydrolase